MKYKNQKVKLFLILILFVGVVFSFYFVFTKKLENYYVIKQIIIKPIMFNDNGNTKIGFGITIKKEFLFKKKQPRVIIFVSTEPGIRGIISPIAFNFIINSENQIYNINDNLICSNVEIKNVISFQKFINDINENKRYTTGLNLDSEELLFYFKDSLPNKNIEIHLNDTCFNMSFYNNINNPIVINLNNSISR